MDMILIRANFQKFQLIALLDLETNIFQAFIDYRIKDRPTILGRKNQVLQQDRNIMTLMKVLAHASSLRRKQREIYPQGI